MTRGDMTGHVSVEEGTDTAATAAESQLQQRIINQTNVVTET